MRRRDAVSCEQINLPDELIVDNFAGGGGASTGIELATGRLVDIAINHDPDAILMHRTNHPHTMHYQVSVWDVDPEEVCMGCPVGLAWFSPDCKHFSKAKGGKPVDKNIRGLAWIVLRWAGTVRPRVIILENVEEFQTWGPVRRGKPVRSKSGQTFRRFISQLEDLGYAVEWRELVAADYGAPTVRKRFFMIARCDGKPIVWPASTHAPAGSPEVLAGKKKAWRGAAEIIDWSLPCPSIFDNRGEIKKKYGLSAQRPLRPNTMRRVARGMDKFVLKEARPYLVVVNHGGDTFRGQGLENPLPTVTGKHGYRVTNPVLAPWTVTNTSNSTGQPVEQPVGTARTGGGCEQMMVVPSLIQYHTEQSDYVRGQGVDRPILTVDSANRYGLMAPVLTKYYGEGTGQDLRDPAHTVTAKDRFCLTAVHMAKFKGPDIGQHVAAPLHTVTAGGGTFALVRTSIQRAVAGVDLHYWPQVRGMLNTYCGYELKDDEVLLLWIDGAAYFIADIGLRMLTPRELYNAMGFPPDYIIDRDYLGNAYGKSKQVARCGNAVPPPFATALVRANLPEWCGEEITTMAEFNKAIAV